MVSNVLTSYHTSYQLVLPTGSNSENICTTSEIREDIYKEGNQNFAQPSSGTEVNTAVGTTNQIYSTLLLYGGLLSSLN